MRSQLVLSLVLAVVLACGVQWVRAQEDEFVIESSIYQHTMPLVYFNHLAHMDDYGYDCTDCHHVYKGGENVWSDPDSDPVKCEECHNEPTTKNEKRLPLPKQKLNLKLAYHGNCIGCHRTYNHENNVQAAPITCKGCHTEKP